MKHRLDEELPWEYLIHGPISGNGLATFDISTFKDNLGSLWDDRERLDKWGGGTIPFFNTPTTSSNTTEFLASEKTAGLITQVFDDQVVENL